MYIRGMLGSTGSGSRVVVRVARDLDPISIPFHISITTQIAPAFKKLLFCCI